VSERRGTNVSKSGTGRPAGRGAPSGNGYGARLLGTVGQFARRRPGVILGVVCVMGAGGTVAWNALTQQANRHPAPLFGKVAAKVEPPRRPDIVATPAPAPVPPQAVPIPARRPDPVAAVPPPALIVPEVPARPASGPDPIGAMIRASDPSAAPDAKSDPKLSNAQKALAKLGYGPLRADGLMGATTRQALERFERDHNLPVTGSLGQRTTRQLASSAGTKID
jgi:hypothetical protein